MDTDQIERVLKKKCGKVFIGVFPRDRLPESLPARRPLLAVCNTDPHDRPGEHWIAIYIERDSRGEYFDSFGEKPGTTFQRYMDKYCISWNKSERRIQSVISSFCGHYCIFYCIHRCDGYDLDTITNFFTNDTALNDSIAHRFACERLL